MSHVENFNNKMWYEPVPLKENLECVADQG
jgi:hypothetical protein